MYLGIAVKTKYWGRTAQANSADTDLGAVWSGSVLLLSPPAVFAALLKTESA